MQKLLKTTLYVFIVILAATALLVLAGLAYLWFYPSSLTRPDLPYLRSLVTLLILETASIVIAFARKSFRYLPCVENHKKESKTLDFMKRFVASGSTVQIVSSRLSWIQNSPALITEVCNKAQSGTLVEIITPAEVTADIRGPLSAAGVRFFVTGEQVPPEARFTLINGNRSGAERLAIARGSHPDHEVTIFDNYSGPQIIGMAKDVIRKSKEIADARGMGQSS